MSISSAAASCSSASSEYSTEAPAGLHGGNREAAWWCHEGCRERPMSNAGWRRMQPAR